MARIAKQGGVAKARKPKRRPSHLTALNVPYEEYITLNGGEQCGICGRPPSSKRRLDRDHCHDTGKPRGLLCHRCNRALPQWMTVDWLKAAVKYLRRVNA